MVSNPKIGRSRVILGYFRFFLGYFRLNSIFRNQMKSKFLQQAPIYGRSCGKGGEMRGLIQIEQLGRVILGVNNPIIWVVFIWVINPALRCDEGFYLGGAGCRHLVFSSVVMSSACVTPHHS